MITEIEKQKIRNSAAAYVTRHPSQNAAANTLKGISSATLNHVLQNKLKNISDKMWRNLSAGINYSAQEWHFANTKNHKELTSLLHDAKEESMVFCTIGPTGCGKSVSLELFANNTANAFLIQCDDFWNKKIFLSELLRSMGRKSNGLSVAEMMYDIVAQLKKLDHPIILIDEVDKLPDHVLYFFITLYNRLEDYCSIVLASTDYFIDRMKRGLRLNKKGFQEIWSRFGRKYIHLYEVPGDDVRMICILNGVEDKGQIREIIDGSESDIRRVKRMVRAIKRDRLKAA